MGINTLLFIITPIFHKLTSYNKDYEYIKFFYIGRCKIFMKSNQIFACKLIETLEILLKNILNLTFQKC